MATFVDIIEDID